MDACNPKVRYLIDSLDIESEVIDISTGEGEAGPRVAKIKTICCGRSQVTHHSDYGPQEGLLERLSSAQRAVAEQFVKEIRGTAEQPSVYQGVRVFMPQRGRWSSLMLAVVDETLPFTLLQGEAINALGLEATGFKVEIKFGMDLPRNTETYKAKLKLGDDEYEAIVAPVDMQVPCILGADVVRLAKAKGSKVYYQILDNDLNRACRNGIRSKNNSVLIIGSFKDGDRARLEVLREMLFAMGYRGIMIDDFADISDQTLEEKLIFFASLCKFVFCLDVNPAGHYVELSTCARCGFITAIVLGVQGKSTTAMIADMEIRNPFMKFFRSDPGGLAEIVEQVVGWADHAAGEKASKLDQLYGWRHT